MDNGSWPTRGVGRLPGPLSDQQTILVERELPLTWFLITALLSKPQTKVSSVYTWTGDTAEGVDISRSVHDHPSIYKKNNEKIMTPSHLIYALQRDTFSAGVLRVM